MTSQWKRRLAGEGLILIIGVAVGILLVPLVFVFRGSSLPIGELYLGLLSVMFRGKSPVFKSTALVSWQSVSAGDVFWAWAYVLAPYAVYQFVRSIVWAVKTCNPRLWRSRTASRD
jgi:hypothetical protein